MMPEEKFRRTPEVELYLVGDIPEEDITGLEDFLEGYLLRSAKAHIPTANWWLNGGDKAVETTEVLIATDDKDRTVLVLPGDVLVKVKSGRIDRYSRSEFESIYGCICIWKTLVAATDKKNTLGALDLHGDQ